MIQLAEDRHIVPTNGRAQKAHRNDLTLSERRKWLEQTDMMMEDGFVPCEYIHEVWCVGGGRYGDAFVTTDGAWRIEARPGYLSVAPKQTRSMREAIAAIRAWCATEGLTLERAR